MMSQPEGKSAPQPPAYPTDPPPPYNTVDGGPQVHGVPPYPPGVFGYSQGAPSYPQVAPTYSQGVPVYPQPGFVPTQSAFTGTTQVITVGPGVTVVRPDIWGPYPIQMQCPLCQQQITTQTRANPGLLTWLLAGALILVGCGMGCCLIPCCIDECQDVDHKCPNCKQILGSYKRL